MYIHNKTNRFTNQKTLKTGKFRKRFRLFFRYNFMIFSDYFFLKTLKKLQTTIT